MKKCVDKYEMVCYYKVTNKQEKKTNPNQRKTCKTSFRKVNKIPEIFQKIRDSG